MAQPEEEAKDIALSLELFVNGSLNIFNHQTNVDVDNRFTVYGIRDLGTELSPITMLVMMESIQNRIVENGKRGKATWLYNDEFHVLLNSEYSAKYLQQLWKKVRKQGGLCTGITQNVVDLLQNYTATTMLANSEFVALLKQASSDSSKMSEVIKVSEAQLRCKTDEEREFYIRLCIKENYSKRQLERQLDSGYYERYMLSKETLLPESVKKLGENPFLDSYVMEFLDLPNEFHENDLRKALIRNMKDFILELGKDFTFIDEEYKVQVGGDDYRIDLLFYHRGLQCLVAIELKIGKFKPEYISKLDFYLEALDRQVKKEKENPSVGLLLCAAKNDEVVEYAMSRTMSPMLVSQYQLQLPDKAVLEKKLQQLVNIPQIED